MSRASMICIGTALGLLSGCGKAPASGPTSGSAPAASVPATTLPPSAQSDSVRAAFAALGQTLPPLSSAISRGNGEVLALRVDSDAAEPTWRALHTIKDKTGWYPVICRDDRAFLANPDPNAPDPQTTLAAAARIEPSRWFEVRGGDQSDPENTPPRQRGATADAPTAFQVPFDILSGKPVPDLYMLLVPTTRGHEVPAFVPFGGWNACPNDEEHVAVLRSWFDRFGAELVTMSGDILELQVSRPPASDAAAMGLALEQFHYCEDIVTQGVGSIDALARTLSKSRIWFFWWD